MGRTNYEQNTANSPAQFSAHSSSARGQNQSQNPATRRVARAGATPGVGPQLRSARCAHAGSGLLRLHPIHFNSFVLGAPPRAGAFGHSEIAASTPKPRPAIPSKSRYSLSTRRSSTSAEAQRALSSCSPPPAGASDCATLKGRKDSAQTAANSPAQFSASSLAQHGAKIVCGFRARRTVSVPSTASCPPHCGSAVAPPQPRAFGKSSQNVPAHFDDFPIKAWRAVELRAGRNWSRAGRAPRARGGRMAASTPTG